MKYFFTKSSVMLLMMLLAASAVMAQLTVTGNVKDNVGQPLIGVSSW